MKMMEKIRLIVEAYSMQPNSMTVLTEEQYKSYYDKSGAIKEIKKEIVGIDFVPTEVYIGYNFEGQKIFQYLAKSVNVHYSPQPLNP